MKIDIVKIELNNLPNIIVTPEQYANEGGYRGIMKSFALRPGTVKKVKLTKMKLTDFAELQAWGG